MTGKPYVVTGKPDKTAFARRLKALMAARGWNQTHLSWVLFGDAADGYPARKDRVSNWVNGKQYPSAENLERIAKAFDITVDELVRQRSEPSDLAVEFGVHVYALLGIMRQLSAMQA